MNRRELLMGLAAGGMVVAGELWVPGKKLISIPSGKHLAKLLDCCGLKAKGRVIQVLGPDDGMFVPVRPFDDYGVTFHRVQVGYFKELLL